MQNLVHNNGTEKFDFPKPITDSLYTVPKPINISLEVRHIGLVFLFSGAVLFKTPFKLLKSDTWSTQWTNLKIYTVNDSLILFGRRLIVHHYHLVK